MPTTTPAIRSASIARTRVSSVLVLTGLIMFGVGVWRDISPAVEAQSKGKPQPRRTPRPKKYSEFPHDIKAHTAECSTCHKFPSDNWKKVRTGEEAFPDVTDYPKHESCLSCHRQQFFSGATPTICTICHTNPSPRNRTRHPFPNPRELFDASPKGKNAVSDFVISFPHDKHIEIVTGFVRRPVQFQNVLWTRTRRLQEESCSVCHSTYQPQGESAEEYVTKPPADLGDGYWLKKGTFKTSPISHTQCFTCHSADSGLEPAPSNCAACHKIKPPQPRSDFDAAVARSMGISDKITLDAWRRRDSTAKFRHEWFSHAELSCSTCHNVSAMNTALPGSKRVTISSCSACHVTPTTDEGGALNIEIDARKEDPKFQCIKCHISFGDQPIPKSHLDAIRKASGN